VAPLPTLLKLIVAPGERANDANESDDELPPLSLSAIVDAPETAPSGPATSLVNAPMKLIVPALSAIAPPLDSRFG